MPLEVKNSQASSWNQVPRTRMTAETSWATNTEPSARSGSRALAASLPILDVGGSEGVGRVADTERTSRFEGSVGGAIVSTGPINRAEVVARGGSVRANDVRRCR